MNYSKEPFILTFSDLGAIVKKSSRSILLFVCLFSFLFTVYKAIKPVEYKSTASFQEKGKNDSGLNSSLNALLSGSIQGTSQNSGVVSVMKSKTILKEVIEKEGLQLYVHDRGPFSSLFFNFFRNIKAEWSFFWLKNTPFLADINPSYTVKNVTYSGEEYKTFFLEKISKDQFEIREINGSFVGRGKIGEPFSLEPVANGSFTITAFPEKDEGIKKIKLIPLEIVYTNILEKLEVNYDAEDKNLVNLEFKSKERFLTESLLNTLMDTYQNFLEKEQKRVAAKQIAYLREREEKMRKDLIDSMHAHAENISSDISTSGFIDSKKAMEFLAAIQNNYRQIIQKTDLEIDLLDKALKEKKNVVEKISYFDTDPTESQFIMELRELSCQRDALDLALQTNMDGVYSNSLQVKVQDPQWIVARMEEIKRQEKELIEIEGAIVQGKSIKENSLLKDPHFLMGIWLDKFYSIQEKAKAGVFKTPQESKEELLHAKNGLLDYIQYLRHFFDVYEKDLRDQLTRRSFIKKDLRGIDWATNQEMYISFSKNLSEIQEKKHELGFLLHQVQDPKFDVSSLSGSLNDPVSLKIIAEASEKVLRLKDQANRSLKEQERLAEDIFLQRAFFLTHLQQNIDLLSLREALLQERVFELQNAALDLIKQKMSLLENHIHSHLKNKLEALKAKKILYEEYEIKIQKNLATLPFKWVSEKLVDQYVNIHEKMVEEISKMVESKNITDNLQIIRSAPLDKATAPLIPLKPKLFLMATLGALFGFVSALFWQFSLVLQKGLPVTLRNLERKGKLGFGPISKNITSFALDEMKDSDVNILRKVALFIESYKKKETCLTYFFALGKTPNITPYIATLLFKRKHKVLVIPLYFEENHKKLSTFLEALQNDHVEPEVYSLKNYDSLFFGNPSRFSIEEMQSDRGKEILEKLKKQYDFILGVSFAPLNSPEVEILRELFEGMLLGISDERNEEIDIYLNQTGIPPLCLLS